MNLLSKSRDRLLFCSSAWALFLCDTWAFGSIRRQDTVWYFLGWFHFGIRSRQPKTETMLSTNKKKTRLLFEDPYFAVGLCPRWAWGWQRTGTEVNSLVVRLGWLRVWVDPQPVTANSCYLR